MSFSLHFLFQLIAAIMFLLAACGVSARINLEAAGLFFWLVSTML